MRKYLIAAAGIGMIASANGAFAASATSNFNVSVTVASACTVTASPMFFGNITGSIPANTTATSTATVICNKGTSYALSFNGTNSVANATANMANGTNIIAANLTVPTTSQTASGGSDFTTIDGIIPTAVNNPAPGTYQVSQAIYVLY